jgi:diaminopimelate epimerase
MIRLNYTKMSGAGNTFIVLDGRELPGDIDLGVLAPAICDEGLEHGGADGLMAIEEWSGGDFTMRYYNRDGSTGMMCGNGGRCAVRFAVDHGFVRDPSAISFINAGVVYSARLTDSGVKVSFPDPRAFRLGFELPLADGAATCSFADVGTPHAIIFVDEPGSLSALDIDAWGPAIRRHEAFAPEGANANFVTVTDEEGSAIRLRTFERGVEGETGACGTGAVSSAIVAAMLRGLTPPVAVTTTSGALLRVDFRLDGDTARDVSLEGDAEVLREGRINAKF